MDITEEKGVSITISNPQYVGYYQVGDDEFFNFKFVLFKKPNIVHRFFVRTCMGFKWKDIK